MISFFKTNSYIFAVIALFFGCASTVDSNTNNDNASQSNSNKWAKVENPKNLIADRKAKFNHGKYRMTVDHNKDGSCLYIQIENGAKYYSPATFNSDGSYLINSSNGAKLAFKGFETDGTNYRTISGKDKVTFSKSTHSNWNQCE